jgi:hypothetical protein
LVAFWGFLEREDDASGKGNFVAHTAVPKERRYPLQPWNISRAFWLEGNEATLAAVGKKGTGSFLLPFESTFKE